MKLVDRIGEGGRLLLRRVAHRGSKLLAVVLAAGLAAVVCLSCTEDGDTTNVYYTTPDEDVTDTADGTTRNSPVSPIVAGEPIEPIDLTGKLIRGVDLGSVIAEEASGVVYKDEAGEPCDIFKLFRDNGINCVRVRIWNDPYDDEGNLYGGGVCDVPVALQIAKRCAAVGLPLFVDFHCSDFWADPSKQTPPKAWQELTLFGRAAKIKAFVRSTLCQIQDTGASVYMVQIGNETTNGFCGVQYNDATNGGWKRAAALFNAGAAGVRAAVPNALVAIHFTNANKLDYANAFAKNLKAQNVDYDVFASSWYPCWHGDLANLAAKFDPIVSTYGKKVVIAEYAHPYTFDDGDGANTITSAGNIGAGDTWDVSVAGQKQFIEDTLKWCNKYDADGDGAGDCLGAFWWEPAWIPVPVSEGAANDAKKAQVEREILWDKYGSGWATPHAYPYDKGLLDDKNHVEDNSTKLTDGGSAEDNKAVFDWDGKALASIEGFGITDLPQPSLPVTVEVVKKDVAFNKNKIQAVVAKADFDAVMPAGKSAADVSSIIIEVADPASGKTQTDWLDVTLDATNWTPRWEAPDTYGGTINSSSTIKSGTPSAFIQSLLSGGLFMVTSNSKDKPNVGDTANTVSETRNVTVKMVVRG